MRNAIISVMILSGGLFASSGVLADEVIIHRDQPSGIVVPPVAVPPPNERDTVIEHRSPDCETTTIHKENDRGELRRQLKRRPVNDSASEVVRGTTRATQRYSQTMRGDILWPRQHVRPPA